MAKAAKFVLIVGDEGGILSYVEDGKVVRRLYAPTSNYTDTRSFLECFESDKDAPIYLLVDVMDQSYVQQSLPPVSSFSVNNLIKRKMARDFAPEDLKGALLIGREKEGRKDWKYLFVTLTQSPQLNAWIDLVIDLPNPFEGIYMLPVEVAALMEQLRGARTGKKGKKNKKETTGLEEKEARWQLMVAHNKVGGFRQVVTCDGKLIFARLAQPIGDTQPAVVAGSIEQEISVTLEYLKRLGYSDDQGLEMYVVVSEAIKSSLDTRNIHATKINLMTPHEVSQKLAFEQVTEPTDQFADIVISAAFARMKKHALRLDTKQSMQLNKIYKAMGAIKIAGILVVIAALCYIGYIGFRVPGFYDEIADLEQQIATAQQQLTASQTKETELPANLDEITDLVALHDLLSDTGVTPFDHLAMYEQSTKAAHMLLSGMTWENNFDMTSEKAAPLNQSPEKAALAKSTRIVWNVQFFETKEGTKPFLKKVDLYTKALSDAFADYKVNLMSELPGIQKDKSLQVGLETAGVDPVQQMESYGVSYEVIGPFPKAAPAGLAPPGMGGFLGMPGSGVPGM